MKSRENLNYSDLANKWLHTRIKNF
jgi:hypothetical protein